MKYAVIVMFRIREDMIESFLPLILSNAEESLTLEPGCHRFDVLRSEATPYEIILYEIYENENAFREHCDMPHFASFERRSQHMVNEKTVIYGTFINDVP